MNLINTGAFIIHLLAAALFIVGLKMLSGPKTARQGNTLAAVGMLLGDIGTAYGLPNWIALVAGAAVLVIFLRLFGKPVGDGLELTRHAG